MKSYTTAVIQMNSQPDISYNLEQARGFIRQAAGEGADIAGLPENFAFLGDLPQRVGKADEISRKAEVFLSDTAREYGIYLLGGSYPVPAGDGKTYNRCVVVDPGGRTVAWYDKIHLFDVDLQNDESYRESDYVEAGAPEPVIFQSDTLGTIGLSVCYDLRFPELYSALTAKGAEILAIPSAFTETTGKTHWEVLLRARAIENTAYVFAPAQTGVHGENRQTYGHAMVVDPWGKVVADAGKEPGIVLTKIDPEKLESVRRSIPSLRHRRL